MAKIALVSSINLLSLKICKTNVLIIIIVIIIVIMVLFS